MKTNEKKRSQRSRSKTSMSEAIHRMRIRTFIIMMVEFIALGFLVAMYILNIQFGEGQDAIRWNDFFKESYWMYVAAGVAVFDVMFLWLSELRLSSIRQKSDLDASSIIGSDVQEAYNFGEIGLVITDDDFCVMWVSPLLKERHLDILDVNILEWREELQEVADIDSMTDKTVQIEANSLIYKVKYLPSAHLFIFRDVSDYEGVNKINIEHGLVLGVVMIDNYEDITGKTENENSDLITKVRSVILDYFREKGAYLRRFRNDSYFIVANYASLEKMEEDRFSVVDKVHNIDSGSSFRPTISIGVAHDYPDPNRLNDMSANALDIALSRGGDQVVVSKYGADLVFYGGRTAQNENTGRVQFRSLGDSLKSLIMNSSDVLVSGHTDADMDAMGSCFGILALCQHLGKPCRVIFDPDRTEKKTRAAIYGSFTKDEIAKTTISSREAAERINPSTLFILVDVSNPNNAMGRLALEKASKTVVIDHHRRGSIFVDNPVLNFIEPSASSASELITEMLYYMTANPRVEIPPTYATLMLGGIFLDTGNFESKSTGTRTFEAAQILKGYGADNGKIYDFFKDDYDEYRLVTSIVSTLRSPESGVYYCMAENSDIVEEATISKVANQLIHIMGVHACFVIGRVSDKELKISGRSDGSINVQLICENIAGKGNGGGHFQMAASKFPGTNVEFGIDKLLTALKNHLDEARSGGAE